MLHSQLSWGPFQLRLSLQHASEEDELMGAFDRAEWCCRLCEQQD